MMNSHQPLESKIKNGIPLIQHPYLLATNSISYLRLTVIQPPARFNADQQPIPFLRIRCPLAVRSQYD